MKFLTLQAIKAQCRIEEDFTLEDTLLESYGDAAEETVTQYLGRGKTVDDMVASMTEEYGGIPKSVVNAALMLVDTWYQHRSPASQVSISIVPYTFDILIKPYMKL